MMIPPELLALSPAQRDGVLALAAELVRAEHEPIDGLSPQQTRLVLAVRAVAPRIVPYDTLAQIVSPAAWGGEECRRPVQLHVIRHHIRRRRPDLWKAIRVEYGVGLGWAT